MITASTQLVRNEALLTAPIGSDTAMLDMDSGKYFVLPEVAAFIWERLARPSTAEELCVELQERYEVTAERCRADVLAFLQKAHDRGLVRPAG